MSSDGEDYPSSENEEQLVGFANKNNANVRKMFLVNDVGGLKTKREEYSLKKPWVETFDVTVDLGTISKNEDDTKKSGAENDFQIEMNFYNQARAASMEAIQRLGKLSIVVQRPKDYFAEMVKSDAHMQKVQEKLLSRQTMIERSEKARELREQRKHGKQMQQEILRKRQSDKKVLMDNLKKRKKGKMDASKLLEERKNNVPAKEQSKKRKLKDQHKNEKYGYGGKKKRSKYNTADSSAYFPSNKHNKFFNKKGKGGHAKRPGKSKRNRRK